MFGFSYSDYDGLGLAELIAKKEISRSELVEEAISAVERINPELNAVINKMYDSAREAANQNLPGNFQGVPMLLKNLLQEIKDFPITSGSKAFRNYRAKEDSEYVKRLKAAGVLLLGQTNIPEFAIMAVTEPSLYGPTRNPWNTNFTPGGSSGGSAAAVASGMVPIAGANDGGGSIRIPAAYCGLFGLKPSRGRTPVGPGNGRLWQGAVVDHVLTRTVRDSAAMLDELKVFEKAAAFHAPDFQGSYLQTLQLPLKKKLRIAFSYKSPLGTEIHPECKNALMNSVKFLESIGHIMEEKDAPVDGNKITTSFLMLYFGQIAAMLSEAEKHLGRKAKFTDVEPVTWLLGVLGNSSSAGEFALSLNEWDKAACAMEDFHETYDFYVTPTTAFPPAKIGELDPKPLEKAAINIIGRLGLGSFAKKIGIVDQLAAASLTRTPFTQLANLTGQPAMSVPLHLTADGLPVGVQFMSARGREDLLLQMACLLEQTELWIDVRSNPMFNSGKA